MNRVSWKQTKIEWRNGNWEKKKAQSGAWDDGEIRKQIKYGKKKEEANRGIYCERGKKEVLWMKTEAKLKLRLKACNNKNSIILRKKRESL